MGVVGEKIGIGYTLTRSLERARRCGRVLFSASRRLAAPVVAMLLLFCYAPAFADPLPKTGQTFCYDASGVTIACLGTGQDGDNQAGVPWPAPRFTDNLDGSISDHLDGLMWVQDANLMLTRDPGFDADGTAGDGAVTWQTALNYVAQLNATAYLGYTDWRLPNRHELRSLADYDWALPALPAGHPFIGLPATNFPYWTSTSDATTPASAWGVDIDFGTTAIADKVATSTQFVWPVRNGAIGTISLNATGQTVCYDAAGTVIACAGTGQDGELLAGTPFPVPRFTDNLDGTVSDNLTTLMWIQDANLMLSRDPGVDTSGKGDGAVVWQTGLDYAALLNSQAYLGYVDWRMPNISELQSLADADTVGAPRLPAGHPFLNVNSSYWSSTTSTANPAMAMIALTFGEVAEGTKVSNKKSDLRFVWLVRGGTYNPPVLAPIGNQAVDEGATLNVTATATDLDGDPLTLAATGLPAFCSFTDNLNDSGSLACTPGQTDAGVYSGITVAANDGLLNDSEVISLTVAAVNVAPVLAPIGNQSVDEGAALNLTVTASDADGDALTLIAAGLPAFCSFTDNLNGTGSLDCTPGQMDAGNYPGISVTAADGILSANEVITLTVNDVNRAPVLNPIGAQSVDENVLLSFTVSGSDPDGDPLTFSATGLPVGASFNPATRVFSWTPDYTQANSYNVTFDVTDGALNASEVVTVTVNDVNRAPVLNPIGAQSVDENVLLSFTVSGSDPDGDGLVFSATGLPVGASFNPATRVFSWTPDYTQANSYNVTFDVTDGALNASEVVTITVNDVNRAPVLNPIGAQSVDENVLLSFTVSGSDPDGDGLVFSATGLPVGASFNPATRVFSWTPDYTQANSYNVTFDVTDGALNASEVVTITVNDVNRAPVLNPIGAQSVDENVLLSFTVSGSDPDGDGLVFSATGLPTGASFNPATRVFSWTPDYTQANSYNVTFDVTDGALNASEVVTITVNDVNRAPVLNPIGNQSMNESATLTVPVTASDVDGDALTLSASGLPAFCSFVDNGLGSGTLSCTTVLGDAGSYPGITVTVTDGALNANEVITLTVGAVNQPPVLNAIGPKVVAENVTLLFTVSGSDPDGDPLTFSATGLPAGASFNPATRVFSWTPDYTQANSYNVTFDVTDGALNASEVVTITVNDINPLPVLNPIGNQVVDEGATLVVAISATDPEGGSLTLAASGLPTFCSFVDAGLGSGTLTCSPSNTDVGIYSGLTITADEGVVATSEVFTLTVNQVNLAPVLDFIGNQSVAEGASLTVPVSASDPDGDALTLSASGLPAFCSFVDNGLGSGTLSCTPASGDAASYPGLSIAASDGTLTTSEVITLTVLVNNAAPQLDPIGSSTVAEGNTLILPITGNDPDGDPVTISATGLPGFCVLTDNGNATGSITCTPGYFDAGNYNGISIAISDGSLTSTSTWPLTVTNTNQAPVLASIGNKAVVMETLLSFTVNGSDIDPQPLFYSATGLPTGAAFESISRSFVWVPTAAQVGTHFVTFQVNDGFLSDQETIQITVTLPIESCDGIDNDGDGLIDEGFTDTDADGQADCVDLDDDNDGYTDIAEIKAGSDPVNSASIPEICGDGLDNDLDTVVDNGCPDPYTPVGTNVPVISAPEVTVTFDTVQVDGFTNTTASTTGPAPPEGFKTGTTAQYLDITTTATFSGTAVVCVEYDPLAYTQESNLHLLHDGGSGWVDITSAGSPDIVNHTICGTTNSFSPFVVVEATPILVSLSAFNLASDGNIVSLSWVTASEFDNEGFNLLRADAPDGLYSVINTRLIPTLGIEPDGADYTFFDMSVVPGGTYHYILQDVETNGKKTDHGPLTITVEIGASAALIEQQGGGAPVANDTSVIEDTLDPEETVFFSGGGGGGGCAATNHPATWEDSAALLLLIFGAAVWRQRRRRCE